MKKLFALSLFSLLLTTVVSAATRDNDDTCDVKVGPAATLLIPYFEVDVTGGSGQTTLFTVTNVTRYPQIAHVTIWTDYGFPVFTFNLYLTGYDVQAINLADVLVRGVVASPAGTPSSTKPGSLSSGANPNFQTDTNCANTPGTIPASLMAAVRGALTVGTFGFGGSTCSALGNVHQHAIGYLTIDVVSNCTPRIPNDPLYYTTDLLFDNVLLGDYQNLGPQPAGAPVGAFDASGNPMVHIRAVPEGGGAGSNVPTALPYTFYDRYTPSDARARDRRQPLPSVFAARFIQGGTAAFATNLNIWREGIGTGSCADAKNSSALLVPEIVRFDEHENPFIGGGFCTILCGPQSITLPAASSRNTSDSSIYPPLNTADVGGWLYLNLNNGGSTSYSVTRNVGGAPAPTNNPGNLAPLGATTTAGPRPSQNWVTVTMFGHLGNSSMTAEFDAASLGNGCSPAAFLTMANGGSAPIGPAGGVFVCPPGPTLTNGTTTQCIGTNVNPTP
ncbi:MAG: hypothetical protein QOK37_94 [Thermoanaerobaculia bacterium]|jgi:hypothetical protein|nr:hypothetical protein [Thermoanaerobaculia bacterium]